MSNARDKANIPSLNFSSTGIDDNATSTAITINSSQNVDVAGTLTIDDTLSISNGTASGFLQTSGSLLQFGTSTAGDIPIYTNNTERMRINSSGNVGIGTSSPSQKLHVVDGAIQIESTSATGNSWYYAKNADRTWLMGCRGSSSDVFSIYDLTADAERMRIDSSGKVLVGTTSTTIDTSNFGHYFDSSGQYKHARDANSTQYVTRVFGNAGNFNIAGDGDATNTNNSYTGISDRTLKENIENANSQWDDIKAIEIKNYNLIEYPNKRHLGVIAQDLEETGMSSLVKTDEDGIKSVKYSILYMKAVKALQEAMTRIETLETKVQTLENNQL